MIADSRKFSSSLLLTLAEFSTLIIFAVLLALVGVRSELGIARRKITDLSRQKAEKLVAETNLQQELVLTKRTNSELEAVIANLTKALAGLSPTEVQDRLASFDALEKERNSLQTNNAKLTQDNDELRKRMETLKQGIADTRSKSDQLQKENDRLAQKANYWEELKSAEAKLRLLSLQNESLRREIIGNSRTNGPSVELGIRAELLGFQVEQLKRVVVLFDTSSSMQNSPNWVSAQHTVKTWLTYLPIEECALVKFSSEVSPFPKTGFLRLRNGDDKGFIERNRGVLLQQLGIPAHGPYTDTLNALRTAYNYKDLTLILLFTDGRPQTQTQSFQRLRDQIYELVGRQRRIPINIIGLGDYQQLQADDMRAKKNLEIEFLRKLAAVTGGSFTAH